MKGYKFITSIIILLSCLFFVDSCCGNSNKSSEKTVVTAHRGFWNCKGAEYSENSIAALREAQDNGLWGSEFDVHLTGDNMVIVNHDGHIDGLDIEETDFATLREHKLPNGEVRPSLDEYLVQGQKNDKTMLILEIKPQKNEEREDILTEKCIAALKNHDLYKNDRVLFISFSLHICQKLANETEGFKIQYLEGDISPSELYEMGINGIDYDFHTLMEHPEWVKEAHDLGMDVNCWTVNKEEDIKKMIELGVDCITTNEPLLARKLIDF